MGQKTVPRYSLITFLFERGITYCLAHIFLRICILCIQKGFLIQRILEKSSTIKIYFYFQDSPGSSIETRIHLISRNFCEWNWVQTYILVIGSTGVFAPSAPNSGYTAFSKWPPAAILIFLGAPIFNSYSPKSKCNTSKLVDFRSINIFFRFWGKKMIMWP